MEQTKPSAPFVYTDITSFSAQYINDKILANKKFSNNINIIKDIRNYYETESKNYYKKLSRYKIYLRS